MSNVFNELAVPADPSEVTCLHRSSDHMMIRDHTDERGHFFPFICIEPWLLPYLQMGCPLVLVAARGAAMVSLKAPYMGIYSRLLCTVRSDNMRKVVAARLLLRAAPHRASIHSLTHSSALPSTHLQVYSCDLSVTLSVSLSTRAHPGPGCKCASQQRRKRNSV